MSNLTDVLPDLWSGLWDIWWSLHHNSSVLRTTTYQTRIKKSRPCFYPRLVFNYWLMVTRSSLPPRLQPRFLPSYCWYHHLRSLGGREAKTGQWAHMVSPLMINIIEINTRSPLFLLHWLMLMEAVGVNSVSVLINRCRMEYHLIFAGSSLTGSQLTSPSAVCLPQTTSCESSTTSWDCFNILITLCLNFNKSQALWKISHSASFFIRFLGLKTGRRDYQPQFGSGVFFVFI